MGHRIIEINGQSVVATAHEKIVQALSNSVGEVKYTHTHTHRRARRTLFFRFHIKHKDNLKDKNVSCFLSARST